VTVDDGMRRRLACSACGWLEDDRLDDSNSLVRKVSLTGHTGWSVITSVPREAL
jgi:hypothetical protein